MESYSIKKPVSIKSRKRVGRGMSSGCGKTSSRGMNGQHSRSGSGHRPWFEGGQMPIQRRVPKRGFKNIFKKQYQIVNLAQLEKLGESEVTPDVLADKRIIEDSKGLVKILSDGDLTKSVTVTADAFTKASKEKIEKAGGKTEIRKQV
jgi:large subunit ribosomal protein L15